MQSVKSVVIFVGHRLRSRLLPEEIEKGLGHSLDAPGFKRAWFEKITTRHVLSHSGGLPHGEGGEVVPIFEPGVVVGAWELGVRDFGFSEMQRSALLEIANIGSGHAATALSRLTGVRVDMTVPELAVRPLAGLPPLFASLEEPALDVFPAGVRELEGGHRALRRDEARDALKWLGVRVRPQPHVLGRDAAARLDGGAASTGTYVESCHLNHGQHVSAQPREILRSIPALELRECAETGWCCGSAGSQIITHYETSMEVLDRKMDNVASTGASAICSGIRIRRQFSAMPP